MYVREREHEREIERMCVCEREIVYLCVWRERVKEREREMGISSEFQLISDFN